MGSKFDVRTQINRKCVETHPGGEVLNEGMFSSSEEVSTSNTS